MKIKFSGLFLITVLSLLITVSTNTIAQPIKLSTSGICHDETSRFYSRTKNYTPFDSIAACIKAGGRLPKTKSTHYDAAEKEAIAQGREFVSLYDREDWRHWIDSDGDCQNTRHELLLATSNLPVKFKTAKECNVVLGEWLDPYSGERFFDSKSLDLDHIVPLKFAHGHGGDKWTAARKQAFANDVDNLLLVKASLNRQKGAKSPAEWMPPNQSYRCEYVRRFNTIMVKYDLSYVPSEERIIERMLNACNR